MTAPHPRLAAVIAALEKVREHVDELDATDDVPVSTYNRWIGMLDGVVEGNWKSLALDGDTIPASEMLMHVDAAVAFLEGHQEG